MTPLPLYSDFQINFDIPTLRNGSLNYVVRIVKDNGEDAFKYIDPRFNLLNNIRNWLISNCPDENHKSTYELNNLRVYVYSGCYVSIPTYISFKYEEDMLAFKLKFNI